MRRIIVPSLIAPAILAVGIAAASTQAASAAPPESTVPQEAVVELSAGDSGDSTAPDASYEPVVIVDENGTAMATVTVTGRTDAWDGYVENFQPDSGREYTLITVEVESTSPRGVFEVADSDFALQDIDGFVTRPYYVASAQESADSVPDQSIQLANGEKGSLTLVFETVVGVAADSLFYTPDFDRLVTIAQF